MKVALPVLNVEGGHPTGSDSSDKESEGRSDGRIHKDDGEVGRLQLSDKEGRGERGDGVSLSRWMNAGHQTARTVSPHPRCDEVNAWRVLLRELGKSREPLDAVHETFGMYGQVVLQVLLTLQDCEMDDDHD